MGGGDLSIRPSQPNADEVRAIAEAVADVLAENAVQQGEPEVLVGGAALDAAVRWVHVSDSVGVARLLDGGELLLTTGAGWPVDDGELRAFASSLHRAGIAGIVFELDPGASFRG